MRDYNHIENVSSFGSQSTLFNYYLYSRIRYRDVFVFFGPFLRFFVTPVTYTGHAHRASPLFRITQVYRDFRRQMMIFSQKSSLHSVLRCYENRIAVRTYFALWCDCKASRSRRGIFVLRPWPVDNCCVWQSEL